MQRRQVVRHRLQGVEHVIEILDLGDGAQAAQHQADALPQDGRLADAGIADAEVAVFLLQPRHRLIDAAEIAHVFAKSNHAGIAGQKTVEETIQDFEAIDLFGLGRVDRQHGLDA